MDDLYSKLKAEARPFVLATVVSCEKPTSAKPGDKAIVFADGTLQGWIGGSCAQPIVIREAHKALRDGQPKLLKIGTGEASAYGRNEGVRNFEMTCYSGGTMEIFIEPVLPKPKLVLIGNSPDLQALAQLGQVMNFQIVVADPELDKTDFPAGAQFESEVDLGKLQSGANTYIIVATHGRYDEDALEKALQTQAKYIGLIASKKRAAAIFDYLQTKGVTEDDWQRVKSPAGLDIGAKTPDEIALSILAEIVQLRRQKGCDEKAEEEDSVPDTNEAIDPICGMTVKIDKARYKTEHQGSPFYFCCAGCLQKFEMEPERFIG
ncbi:YHS domain-containing protein [Candidatus Parcubacteria bacterium]|nr:MAG: YHS domain-containing protein [Candidatus Parcubacteria bacterium]